MDNLLWLLYGTCKSEIVRFVGLVVFFKAVFLNETIPKNTALVN